jgi:predicted ATPase
MTKKYALTGGPSSGKSTLLKEIQSRGIYCMKEVAEYIINGELERKGNILPWINRDAFQNKLLETQLEWEREIPREASISFQDRGIPDGIAYYRLDGLEVPRKLEEAARNARYEKVFLLDALPYKKTEIRREDPETAQKVHREIERVYTELGYELIRIPAAPLNYRAELILDFVTFEHDAMKQPEWETMGGENE